MAYKFSFKLSNPRSSSLVSTGTIQEMRKSGIPQKSQTKWVSNVWSYWAIQCLHLSFVDEDEKSII